jgi:hypothetical protein
MRRLSVPTVISPRARFVAALGGTSYAVIKLPARSVGNGEPKSNAWTSVGHEKDGRPRWSGGPAGDPNFVSLDNATFWAE